MLLSKIKRNTFRIFTWNHGFIVNEEAWNKLKSGISGLEAIIAGVGNFEAEPKVSCVGYGGYSGTEGKDYFRSLCYGFQQ